MVIQLCRLWAYVQVDSALASAAGRRRVMVVWVERAAALAEAGGKQRGKGQGQSFSSSVHRKMELINYQEPEGIEK